MNISQLIDNFRPEGGAMTIPAGKRIAVPQMGRYFILKSCLVGGLPSATEIHVALGKSQHFTPWPVLWSEQTRNPDDFFDQVRFYNPSASDMVIDFFISTEWIDNKSAEVTGTITIPIDDTSNGTVSDASIVVQPRTGFLINAAVAVNKGGGKVGIPLTAQPFSTGQAVTISGCPQYNGANTADATSGVNEVVITALFKGGLIDNAVAVDKGGGKVGVPITGHPYTPGETMVIANAHANYNGDRVVDATSTVNEVVITATYAAYTFDGVDDSHNLKFDGVDDKIALTGAQSIAASATQKELHIANHDATYKVYWGDSNVNESTFRGVPIAAESVYIIPCTDQIYLACEAAAGVTGCRVSWNRKTKT